MKSYQSLLALLAGLSLTACGAALTDTAQRPTLAAKAETQEQQARYVLTEVATRFDFPWGIAFLPDGGFLISERDGFVSHVAPGETRGKRLSGVPDAVIERQGGVMDIITDPDFATNRTVYLSYSKGPKDANATAVYRARLSDDGTALEAGSDIYVAATKRSTTLHYGGRLMFLPDGTLLVGLGDGFRYMQEAQNPQNTHGTLVRIHSDGTIPADNPFADGVNGLPEVYSYGHRNIQGLAYDPASDTLYAHEHGPKGGDEINIIEPGNNYGWPEITYGVNYNGTIITTKTEAPGLEQPLLKWVPSIAPSGMVFYTGDRHPGLTGDLLVSALAGSKIQHVDLEKGRVKGETALFEENGERFRHIAQGPDGALYVLVDGLEAPVYRIDTEPAE